MKTLPIILRDEWLRPAEPELRGRYERYVRRRNEILSGCDSLAEYANAHLYFGFQRDAHRGGWWFREWLPLAREVFLFGDFNAWERMQYPLERLPDAGGRYGVWELFLPDGTGIGHGSCVKMYVHGADGSWLDRIPAYIRRVVQDRQTKDYCGQLWAPAAAFDWTNGEGGVDEYSLAQAVERDGGLLIYEAHVGMAQEEAGVGSYREFTHAVLPRIKALGYNAVQLMAIAEHPYYGSFGYHVSNFYAPSSRFGTPEELKELVRTAHGMGLGVIMDLVHSHYVKNTHEGLSNLDGSGALYSPPGAAAEHAAWDSKLFDYGRPQVQHFLLSNIKYWLTEFHFDGFRFDGVSSMLYHHHGLGTVDWGLEAYFGRGANRDAILYLTLANDLAHELSGVDGGSGRQIVTLAEEVSGMPGITCPVTEGGLGFDYRLGMAIPDFWIEYLQDVPDEQWDLHRMWNVLSDRLPGVRTVAYAESHDQALVGDKTIAFRLMDKQMYDAMDTASRSVVVDRGIGLHKLIRLFTITLGGEAYLNFMGNEFGHPEWIDFPREGNGWSYAHARRQWSLAEDKGLRYGGLWNFDRAMIRLVQRRRILEAGHGCLLHVDEANKTIVYERAGLLFVFNWHPWASSADYVLPVPPGWGAGKWRLVLSSDEPQYGGPGRVMADDTEYFTFRAADGRDYLRIYNVTRSALVFERRDESGLG